MWVILPVKGFSLAKQRLADILSVEERQSLARAMFDDVVIALKATESITSIVVVSADDAVLALAAKAGLLTLRESSDCHSLNQAVSEALAFAGRQGAESAMVLHADLPLVNADSLNSICLKAASSPRSVILVSDETLNGTNALICPLPITFELAYGEGSLHKHLNVIAGAGLHALTLDIPSLQLDIDGVADLRVLQRSGVNTGMHTQRWLQQFDADSDLTFAQVVAHPLEENNTSHSRFTNLAKQLLDAKGLYSLSATDCLALAECDDADLLLNTATRVRDFSYPKLVSYSKKVFFPLTHLCRDVCHYCTFAQTPKFIEQAYMPLEQVLNEAQEAAALGCKEALLTLGEKPELRYATARDALAAMGFASTLEYVADVAEQILTKTGILPHINAGCMNRDELLMLKKVSASMGIMLESVSERLCEKGMPHYGSPDKLPAPRLETLRLAGELDIPFTTGILIGIGETRLERIESLLAIRDIHQQYGHIQEVIIQNFRAKAGTKMHQAQEPDLNELLWSIAIARWIFGADMSIQAPPNLSPGVLEQIVGAGINDWGGVSPVTPDFVNPEAPWPNIERLAAETAAAGKLLCERVTIYPSYLAQAERYLHADVKPFVLAQIDGAGLAREDAWLTGESVHLSPSIEALLSARNVTVAAPLAAIFDKVSSGQPLTVTEITELFNARGDEFSAVCQFADSLRSQCVGDDVTFCINRNINYTNICYFKCQFCAFSKGKHSDDLRGKPYDLAAEEISRRTLEAWQRGASEVCMQGGIHPAYTGQTYIDICKTVKTAVPQMHIHAFSPLEIWQGAATLNISLAELLTRLKQAGLATLPGTAAEVLHDDVRATLCSDKINSAQWLEVMRQAHKAGIPSTATIMFGHVDNYEHWAQHLVSVRDLQLQTGGFTEFVPLPFVASEAPIYRKGNARRGPTLRECMLMHAVARISLYGAIDNIQASWVKLGERGAQAALNAGANDVGGTLMNESITRAAGAAHGEELGVEHLERMITAIGRKPKLRTTLYEAVSAEREMLARDAGELEAIVLTEPVKSIDAVQLLKPSDSLDPRDLKEVS